MFLNKQIKFLQPQRYQVLALFENIDHIPLFERIVKQFLAVCTK